MNTAAHRDPNSTLATRASLLADVGNPHLGTRWSEFDRIYRGVVLRIATNAGLPHHDAEEVTQDVFCELARRLSNFRLGSRPGSFRRYLRQLVLWRSHNRLRRNEKCAAMSLDADGAPEPSMPPPSSDPNYEGAVLGAMSVMSKSLCQRDLQILELFHCADWPAKKIASTLNVNERTVYGVARRHKARLAREIRRRIETQE